MFVGVLFTMVGLVLNNLKGILDWSVKLKTFGHWQAAAESGEMSGCRSNKL